MTQAQIELQNALTTTFLANLVFLSEYDNELYHRIDELSRMIEKGMYQEKYALDFIMESGDFDIYDIVNDKYLYNKDPKNYNEQQIKDVQFNEKKAIINIPPEFYIKDKIEIDRSDRFDFKEISQYSTMIQNDMWEYANELNDFLEKGTKKLKRINKFIFIGTLLGRHIPRIAEKINAKMYFVVEKNLEIFRLSLFTVDYTILAKKGVIFSIMDEQRDLEKKIDKFLNIDYFDNNIIKFSTTNINISNYVDTLLSQIIMLDPGIYNYCRYLYVYIYRTIKNITDYKLLLFNKIKENSTFYKNIPVLFCAAGPSLDDNIEWIKENQNKFFIVTIGAAYKKLLDNDIKLDMITTLDEQEHLSLNQFNNEYMKKIDRKTIILASCITSEKVLNKFANHNLFLYEVFGSIYKDNKSFSGYSVGELTLDILLQLNFKKIYLIGLDLALNQTTGETHSKDANSGKTSWDLILDQNRDHFDFRKSLVEVKGNFNEKVFTTGVFFSSIKCAENILSRKNDEVEIFNLSNHGAFFEGTISTKVENIQLKDISFDICELVSFLDNISKKGISSEIKKYYKTELLFIKKDLKDILSSIKKSDFESFKELLNCIDEILILVYNKKYLNLNGLIKHYLDFIIPYLKFYFNDKKVKDEKEKVNRIKLIFVRQLTYILDDYIVCLNKI
jgi:hypothetical protein